MRCSKKELEAKLDLANKNLERLNKLNQEGIAPQKEVIVAQNVKDLLLIDLAGLKEHVVHIKSETEAMLGAYGLKLDKSPDPSKVPTGSPLKSPRDGVIIEKTITLGDVVNTSEPLYVVADLSQVWLDINIYDKDIAKIQIGQSVTFKSDSLAGRAFEGKVNYIQPQGWQRTNLHCQGPCLKIRPAFSSRACLARWNCPRSPAKERPTCRTALWRNTKGKTLSLSIRGNGRFEKRKVELGERTADGYLVRNGVAPGERIVTAGALTLKSELYKNQSGED